MHSRGGIKICIIKYLLIQEFLKNELLWGYEGKFIEPVWTKHGQKFLFTERDVKY